MTANIWKPQIERLWPQRDDTNKRTALRNVLRMQRTYNALASARTR